jgi:hypothetical protein
MNQEGVKEDIDAISSLLSQEFKLFVIDSEFLCSFIVPERFFF